MQQATVHHPPMRITDLISLKQKGAVVTCQPSFEIVPVDFAHRDNQFRAYIFLCRFSGMIDENSYSFRKCYARGCPHNLCPHVSQAVMIANRYLQRDYLKLKDRGIDAGDKLFTLEEMLVQFADQKEQHDPTLTIDDYIRIADEGGRVSVDISLEYVTATEHFEYGKNLQTFLMADFVITNPDGERCFQRCLACYPTEKEQEERQRRKGIANDRLALLYRQFDEASIAYEKRFFE
jgi:hypothetical protein